jgi:dipeptidase D
MLLSVSQRPGMENRKAIVMQGHLDMVHQKNSDTILISTQGIDMYVDEDVRARGTTTWSR